MNNYEMINIIDVSWEEGELAPAEELISQEIAKAGGELLDLGTMGRRKLAYAIEDHTEGNYLLSHFSLSPDNVAALRDSLKLKQAVIRSLIVRYKKLPEIEIKTETVEEIREESPKQEEPKVSTEVLIDEEIIINPEEKSEPLEDLNINLESLPAEDSAEEEKKEKENG
ncbi:MAG: 30S ribosomal protein S6 [Candidatus Auribacterota bacterium]|nr:30S ribosomal protein S6 [Candidatus Auribacterota bacterium]